MSSESAADRSLVREAMLRVLELQSSYDHTTTAPMQERGKLLRGELRTWLSEQARDLQDRFPEDSGELGAEASDGLGRKARVPWLRLYSKTLAPRASEGWYITYLFSADGSAVYLVLGQATTLASSDDLLAAGNMWARKLLELKDLDGVRTESIDLNAGDSSGATFEKGVVSAIRYGADHLPDEEQMATDLRAMADDLSRLYRQMLAGARPPAEDPGWFAEQIHEAVSQVPDLSAPSASKFDAVDRIIAWGLGIPESETYSAGVSKPGNLSVRFDQSQRAQAARVGVAILYDQSDQGNCLPVARGRVESGKPPAMLLVSRDPDDDRWKVLNALLTEGSSLHPRMTRFKDTEIISVAGPAVSMESETGSVAMDDRIERMLRASFGTKRFVVLVGPPGTGKSVLAARLLKEAQQDPDAMGLTEACEALWVTPDESWTVRDLVGGDTVDHEGQIRFRPGWLLQAIAENRHLVIDELNRADMDRIFGPALTFLAGQRVQVGRVSSADESTVRLEWSDAARSSFETDPHTGDQLYRAGRNFRILGTYNGIDAHQVFRLGQALGRRFHQIPIAPVDEDAFAELLDGRLTDQAARDDLAWFRGRVIALYSVHRKRFARVLNPAGFLDVPGHFFASGDEGDAGERLAEAYLACVGGWLARRDPEEIDGLGRAIVEAGALNEEHWNWVRSHALNLT